MAVMVWCQSCKKVVWAYDHQPYIDLRSICNLLKLPCPKCGDEGSFDGWGSNSPVADLASAVTNVETKASLGDVYNAWSAMQAIANIHDVEWEPSPDNRWFPKGVKCQT